VANASLLETAKQEITDLHSSGAAGHRGLLRLFGVLTGQWSDRRFARKLFCEELRRDTPVGPIVAIVIQHIQLTEVGLRAAN
jgi:hypothetical protein